MGAKMDIRHSWETKRPRTYLAILMDEEAGEIDTVLYPQNTLGNVRRDIIRASEVSGHGYPIFAVIRNVMTDAIVGRMRIHPMKNGRHASYETEIHRYTVDSQGRLTSKERRYRFT